MSSKSRSPRQWFILVKVTFNLGTPTYTYLSFTDGSNAETIVAVPGDQVGWYVKVEAGFGWSTPAYQLDFDDPSIFGTESISVPHGGPSGFFTVVALSTEDPKYSLTVSGISPISDPQIQVDPNGTVTTATGVQHNVRWTAATNTMEYEVGGIWQPFPANVNISVGDDVQFMAVLTPPQDFEIIFPSHLNHTVWGSPFKLPENTFYATGHGAVESTGNLLVKDTNDGSGSTFQFVAALQDGSEQSDPFTFTLV